MILASDQGTTGTHCMVFAEDGRVAGRAYREFRQQFPRPGWVEHDAGEKPSSPGTSGRASRSPTRLSGRTAARPTAASS